MAVALHRADQDQDCCFETFPAQPIAGFPQDDESVLQGLVVQEEKTRNGILSTLRAAARPALGFRFTNGQDFMTHDRR
jgi:hypothetical protein